MGSPFSTVTEAPVPAVRALAGQLPYGAASGALGARKLRVALEHLAAPAAEVLPAPHAAHAAEPEDEAYSPAPQRVHAEAPAAA